MPHAQVLYDRTGTKPYMAPELHTSSKSQRRGYSFPVDWFALGVTLWEFMSAGKCMPPPVARMLSAIRSKGKLSSSYPFEDLDRAAFSDPSHAYMHGLSEAAHDFLYMLLRKSVDDRISAKNIRRRRRRATGRSGHAAEHSLLCDCRQHAFFADVNWPSVTARLQRVPWSDEVLREMQASAHHGEDLGAGMASPDGTSPELRAPRVAGASDRRDTRGAEDGGAGARRGAAGRADGHRAVIRLRLLARAPRYSPRGARAHMARGIRATPRRSHAI